MCRHIQGKFGISLQNTLKALLSLHYYIYTDNEYIYIYIYFRASDIVDNTVDEHTLMIYISLLKRKVSDNHHNPAKYKIWFIIWSQNKIDKSFVL